MATAPNLPELNDLPAAVHAALAAWAEPDAGVNSSLRSLLLVRQMRAEQGDDHSPIAWRRATNRVLEGAIEQLAEQDQTGAAVLRDHFIEGELSRVVANRLHASLDQVNRWQRSAIQHLAHILASKEWALRQARLVRLEAELPPPSYTRLFGFDQAQDILIGRLMDPDGPCLVAIAGIGGIGKTSLADAVVRRLIRTLSFEQVVWLRAEVLPLSGGPLPPEQQSEHLLEALDDRLLGGQAAGHLPEQVQARLQQALRAQSCLVVVDDLEVAADMADLVPHLMELANPTRFLLTTRVRPGGVAPVYYHSLEELPLEDAAGLLRHYAGTIGVAELAQASPAEVEAIYQVTGGNPLALKLVVSLAAVLPLPLILRDLAERRPGPAEGLYRHIYWQAWRSLSPNAQTLLQAMPLAAEAGARPEQMRAMSGLDEADFWPAVAELVSRSLLEVRGTIHERRYGIHRLTASFLLSEIIEWEA
jgi:hypothetical protein